MANNEMTSVIASTKTATGPRPPENWLACGFATQWRPLGHAPLRAPFVVLVLLGTGCATMFSGSTKDVEIRAPSDAMVEIAKERAQGMPVYQGPPGKVHLDKGYSYLVTVRRAGLPDVILPLGRSMNGTTLLNILWIIPILWGVGVAVDLATGAFWTIPGEAVAPSFPPPSVVPPSPPPPAAPAPPATEM